MVGIVLLLALPAVGAVVLVGLLALGTAPHPWRQTNTNDSEDSGGGDRPGGPDTRPPPSRPPGGGDVEWGIDPREPEWWPEFERQLAAYLARGRGSESERRSRRDRLPV